MTSNAALAPAADPAVRLADRRLGGLDGLRALAVTLVVVFHLFPGVLPGGFIGVDVFFVVSGYLITSLLLREHRRSGSISLGRFWLRRSRRILPALTVVLLLGSAAAWLVGGDALVALGRQVVGALTFSYNWLALAFGGSYVDQTATEVFTNLWSLAVEEQFYIVWPIALIVLLAISVRMRVWSIGLVVFAAGSALLMWMLVSPADPTRVYYGTDTHAFGLALGAALAFALAGASGDAAAWGRVVRVLLAVLGVLGLAGLVVIAVVANEFDLTTYPGYLLLASIAAAAAILGAAPPHSWCARALETPPVVWVGRRSYGIYLWHWPVYALAITALPDLPRTGPDSVWLGVGALAIALVGAALSYRFVEQPIRTLGYRQVVRRVSNALIGAAVPVWRRTVAIAMAVVVLVLSGIGTAGILADPGQSSAGIEIAPSPPAAPPTAPGPIIAEPQTLPTGDQIMAVGDSVMLASIEELEAAYPGIYVDAAVSRGMGVGASIIEDLAAQGLLRQFVVIGLGTNGYIDPTDLDRIVTAIGPDRYLVLVDAFADRPWTPDVNALTVQYATQYRNVDVARWHDLIGANLGLLAGDQVHPDSDGSVLYVSVVTAALQRLVDMPPPRDPEYVRGVDVAV